jgi:transposase
VNRILWVLAAEVPWRETPERYGPWKTLYECFARWTDDGTGTRVLHALHDTCASQSGRWSRP